ncbi:MAG: sulfate reduction electron transfer complex DsrMKJOP subunit DsrJ [Terriglobales bacterium]|jgi:hypothetical protein
MSDRPFILGGLIVFVAFVTTPVWRDVSTRRIALVAPEIKLPAQEKHCVAPISYMRTSHMQLLDEWREDVVRDQQRQYVAYDGKVYDKSLTRTCLGCHGSRGEFCDRCHSYSGVSTLNCWSCHNDSPLAARSVR